MASLAQERNGNYHIVFWFGGTRFKRSLKTNSLKKAQAAKARLEDTLQLAEIGRLEVPEAADVATFFLSDGKQNSKPVVREARLNPLFDQYFSCMPTGCLEVGTCGLWAVAAWEIQFRLLTGVPSSGFLPTAHHPSVVAFFSYFDT